MGLPACRTSPTAPRQTAPPEFDPTALFAQLTGPYTLTFEADESCAVPPSLKVLAYDVDLSQTPYRYMGVLLSNKPFVGDLWALAREGEGFTLRLNVDCDIPDTVGSTSFYICGSGRGIRDRPNHFRRSSSEGVFRYGPSIALYKRLSPVPVSTQKLKSGAVSS
jgi:hypothetical protein